jgi:hypothetical protein
MIKKQEGIQLKGVTKLIKSIESLNKSMDETTQNVPSPPEFGDTSFDNELDFDDYSTNSDVFSLTFIEFAVLNEYLYSTFRKENKNLVIDNYGGTDSVGRISYGGSFNIQYGWWFQGKFLDEENEYIFQTKIYMDNRKDIISEIQISVKNGVSSEKLYETMKRIKNLAFNNSKYVGKCIKVKLKEGGFRGIEIIDISNFSTELILNETQTKFLNHFVARVGRGGNARYLLNGEPGTGKAQPLDSKILTPNGWVRMGDIKTGTEVITPNGKISKVIGVYPQGEKDIYEIETKDGKKAEACGEHLWKVYGLPNGKERKKSWSIINTLEIKNKLENTKYKLKLPLVSSELFNQVELESELIIPPYLMGILLGDGSFNENSLKLTTSDEFIIDKVKAILPLELNLIHDNNFDYLITRKEGKGYKGGDFANVFVKEIRNLNLSNKKSIDKFIPTIYKTGSLKQKLELLQGLMDSDGTVDKSSHLSYSTISNELAKDVQEIIWSIGGICNITPKQTYYTYKGEKKKGALSYNLSIRIRNPKTIVSLPRKLELISDSYQYNDTLKNNIVSINYVGKKEAQCIMIDDENHLYITNNYVVTHNTESIREIIRKLTPNVTFIIPDFTTNDDLNVILEACEIFESAVIIMDDIDLYLGSRDKGGYTTLLGQFLSFFDGVKKRKISLLASTNDKGLVDRAAERPGRFNMTLDYTFLTSEQIVSVCQIHLPKEYQIQEVYNVLTGTINGKKVNVTGAFIANLADNIKEMSEDEQDWSLDDTLSLIKESYKGFYMSQVEKENGLGFKFD